ncbi:MAG: FtsX-like permease family protein [bacterium]|nr:FtsX-like permease family protein [bacterium]
MTSASTKPPSTTDPAAAQAGDIPRLVLGRGLWISVTGATLGLAAAAAATRVLGGLLHGVSTLDPLTFGGVTVILLAVAVLACYIPALRASRTDPMTALRYE